MTSHCCSDWGKDWGGLNFDFGDTSPLTVNGSDEGGDVLFTFFGGRVGSKTKIISTENVHIQNESTNFQ